MYCTNCGKEIKREYKFCKNCGSNINIEEQNEITNAAIEKEKNISMKYFKFFSTIYLGIIIILNIFTLSKYRNIEIVNVYIFLQLLLEIILYIMLPIKLLYELPKKTKFIYKLLLGFLILDYIYKVMLASINCYYKNEYINITIYIILSTIMYAIWYVPNIIYFIKRKSIFIN